MSHEYRKVGMTGDMQGHLPPMLLKGGSGRWWSTVSC